jgi:hypothetical protein
MSFHDLDSHQQSKHRWLKVSDCNVDATSYDAIVLTLDIDWACDAVLTDCIELVEASGVPATWFVTHDTPLLERLRDNNKFELGIHPNFNPLFDGKEGNAERIIDDILTIVPEAVSVRSHSMVQSSRLVDLFLRKGLQFDCNHFIPEQSGITLKPWKLWNGIIKVPHFWEDDAECIYKSGTPIVDLLDRNGLKVFDFHPIHVFLNTEDLTRYEQTRTLHTSSTELLKYRFSGIGARTFMRDLVTVFENAK